MRWVSGDIAARENLAPEHGVGVGEHVLTLKFDRAQRLQNMGVEKKVLRRRKVLLGMLDSTM
jgi:hypothetical protein